MNDLKEIPISDCPPLDVAFFERDTVQVARALLGCRLLRFHAGLGEWLQFKVVETEAYTADDPACHAYNRKTGRAEMLYQHPGTAYVYLIYGIHDCLNVVTEPHGVAGAVLFRALEPMGPDHSYRTNGPGRLTRALDISRKIFNGMPLTKTETGLYLAAGEVLLDTDVIQTTRIGISKAVDYPWRFYIQGNAWVSAKAPQSGK